MARSARINFGFPDSEIIVECDESGAITSARNVDTDTEYVASGDGIKLSFDCYVEVSE